MKNHRKYRRISTTQLAHHVGQTVQLRGWIHALRALGSINFIVLRDGEGTAQLVLNGQMMELLGEASCESVIGVTGTVVENESAPGGVEVQVEGLNVVTEVTEALPVTLGKRSMNASLPTLLDHAPLTLRHPERRRVFRASAIAMAAFREALTTRSFVEIQTPKLVESATEGGSNVFEVEYFGRKAYLAQSPQFYKQAMVGVFERVFEVGPVFRAEPHATSRHISEYVSLDVELGFITNHREVMAVLTEVLRSMMRALSKIETLTAPEVPETIPIVSFEEAKRISEGSSEELDLSPAEERAIGAWAAREHGSAWVFVEGYPVAKRPFYTAPMPGHPTASNSFDLLFRGQELVTGGQRLHRYTDYLAALAERGLSPEPFAGYLETFRYGMPPHGGFAIGLERLLMQLFEVANIREVTLFPRDMNRLAP